MSAHLRDLCNLNDISCKDKDGHYLSTEQLKKLLNGKASIRIQHGGGKKVGKYFSKMQEVEEFLTEKGDDNIIQIAPKDDGYLVVFMVDDQEADKQQYEEGELPSLDIKSLDIGKILGDGSWGSVTLVRDKATEEVMALKVMLTSDKDRWTTSPLKEFYLQSICSAHPNVLSVKGFFVDRPPPNTSRYFILLEYAPLGTLMDYLPLPEDEVLQYILEITNAVKHCHDRGIVHRDIKPENILIRLDKTSALADFGVATRVDAEDMQEVSHATPLYEAPESDGFTEKVDIWALGVLLCEMVLGNIPGKVTPRYDYPDELPREAFSPKILQILDACLVEDPDKRATAIELLQIITS